MKEAPSCRVPKGVLRELGLYPADVSDDAVTAFACWWDVHDEERCASATARLRDFVGSRRVRFFQVMGTDPLTPEAWIERALGGLEDPPTG
jgi:hypothetical protein